MRDLLRIDYEAENLQISNFKFQIFKSQIKILNLWVFCFLHDNNKTKNIENGSINQESDFARLGRT